MIQSNYQLSNFFYGPIYLLEQCCKKKELKIGKTKPTQVVLTFRTDIENVKLLEQITWFMKILN